MRPKKHETTGTSDLFRARLDQIINMKHELVQLAGKIDWDWLDREIAWLHLHIHRSRSSNANCLCGAVLAVPAQLSPKLRRILILPDIVVRISSQSVSNTSNGLV
jgi:hypothetical protein